MVSSPLRARAFWFGLVLAGYNIGMNLFFLGFAVRSGGILPPVFYISLMAFPGLLLVVPTLRRHLWETVSLASLCCVFAGAAVTEHGLTIALSLPYVVLGIVFNLEMFLGRNEILAGTVLCIAAALWLAAVIGSKRLSIEMLRAIFWIVLVMIMLSIPGCFTNAFIE